MADETFTELRSQRERYRDLLSQRLLAPMEHRAFARAYAQEHPVKAIGLIGAIPAYQLAKALKLIPSRTGTADPMEQMQAGYAGLAEGWIR